MRSSIPRGAKTLRLRTDVLEWLAAESDRRVVSQNLLVEAAVDLLREAVEVAPELVRLPGGLRDGRIWPTKAAAAGAADPIAIGSSAGSG